jgi:hypothetical protein
MKEAAVRTALEKLSWPELSAHLEAELADHESVLEVLKHVQRCGALILKLPDAKREAQRDELLRSLELFVAERVGAQSAAFVQAEARLIRQIEIGYRGLLVTLEHSDVAGLDPIIRVAGILWRLSREYESLMAMRDRQLKQRKHFSHMFMPKDESGQPFNLDGALSAMIEAASMTIKMEAYKNKWFDDRGRVVLSHLPKVDENAIDLAGITAVLALCWRTWERTEERRRYIGGKLVVYEESDLPNWAPEGATRAIEYQPESEWELVDYIANERLHDRLTQTYMEMMTVTSLPDLGKGLDNPLPLGPGNFVSSGEAHSAVSLSEILAFDITADEDRPGGLRLLEWLRGYATLQALAERRGGEGIDNLVIPISSDLLHTTLERVSLDVQATDIFIERATFAQSSWDLFDQPLLLLQDGSYLLFGPAMLQANLARIVLSAVANLGVQRERKGTAFEQDIRSFLAKQPGIEVFHFKARRDDEEYEYDAVAVWEDYIFVLECKNRSLSAHSPIQSYYFGLETAANARQARRLADALAKYPDILTEHVGAHVIGKKVVACVVNSLPFAMPKGIDGVFFTDASALKRFFEKRYLYSIASYNLPKKARLIHRTALKSFWKADSPTPADLILQLENPFQFEIVLKHMTLRPKLFGLEETVVALTHEHARREATTDSVASLMGTNVGWVHREAKRVEETVRKVRRKVDRDLLRQQARAWRKRRQNRPSEE